MNWQIATLLITLSFIFTSPKANSGCIDLVLGLRGTSPFYGDLQNSKYNGIEIPEKETREFFYSSKMYNQYREELATLITETLWLSPLSPQETLKRIQRFPRTGWDDVDRRIDIIYAQTAILKGISDQEVISEMKRLTFQDHRYWQNKFLQTLICQQAILEGSTFNEVAKFIEDPKNVAPSDWGVTDADRVRSLISRATGMPIKAVMEVSSHYPNVGITEMDRVFRLRAVLWRLALPKRQVQSQTI